VNALGIDDIEIEGVLDSIGELRQRVLLEQNPTTNLTP
jgi:hypothetical protein